MADKKLSDEQLVAAKTALDAGTSISKFIEDEAIDVHPSRARHQLIKEHTREVIQPLLRATRGDEMMYQFKRRFKMLTTTGPFKNKKTKFKNDLKAIINKL
jgi:hypothetical protein